MKLKIEHNFHKENLSGENSELETVLIAVE